MHNVRPITCNVAPALVSPVFFKIHFEPFPIRYKREFVYFGTMDMADMMGLVLTMLMIMKLIIIGWGTGGWVDGWLECKMGCCRDSLDSDEGPVV